ncbi:retrovirus-related pol polyprotein from transposon TNT 1-94 [Tanacetum coccineum]
MVLEKKVNIKPINYAELNRLSKLSNEQAFWLQTSHPNTNQFASSPVKIEAPQELPKLIKPSRVRAKEHAESLVNQLNQKSVKLLSLNGSTSGKGFCHNSIKNDLRKFKGKDIVDNATQVLNATTIALGMYKLDLVTLAPKDKNNRETHIYYLKHIMEQAAILKEIVEQAKSLNPLDSSPTLPIRVSRSTKSSKSKSTNNTKIDRIMQISSSTQKKNKVEDHSRIVKSSLNKSNCVVEPSGNALKSIKVVKLFLWLVGLRLPQKHMTGIALSAHQFCLQISHISSKDDAPDFIIKFLKMIQVRLNAPIRNIRTYNGTEFVNQTLRSYYKSVGISHETSVARSPQQNGVVERRNRTLVEAARTMLIYAKDPLFRWA